MFFILVFISFVLKYLIDKVMVVGKSRGGVVRNTLKTVILYCLTNIALLSVQRKLVGDSAFFQAIQFCS